MHTLTEIVREGSLEDVEDLAVWLSLSYLR